MRTALEEFGTILQYYQLHAEYIEDYGKVKKVYSKNGVFALKECHSNAIGLDMISTLQKKGYRNMITIYPTVSGSYTVQYGDRFYYLTPWIERIRETDQTLDIHVELMREVAKIHQLTVRKKELKSEWIQQFYTEHHAKIETRRTTLLAFLEKCEKKVYMSPFELHFCLNYQQIMQFDQVAKGWLEQWYEEDNQATYERHTVCHGHLLPSHLITDKTGRHVLTNFEKSFIGPPLYDLMYFYRHMLYLNIDHQQYGLKWYDHYASIFPLSKGEKSLFFYHMTHVYGVEQIVHHYETNQSITELEHVKKLQKQIWLIQASHYVIGELDRLARKQQEAAE